MTSDIEGVLNPTLMKEPSTSPTADRKKQRRKKNGTQRSESTLGHAEGQKDFNAAHVYINDVTLV